MRPFSPTMADMAGVRERGLLESAVHAPRIGYYTSLAELAAVYTYGIAKNHPFLDSNKRTALVVALVFLEMNGHVLTLGFEWAGHIEPRGNVLREGIGVLEQKVRRSLRGRAGAFRYGRFASICCSGKAGMVL